MRCSPIYDCRTGEWIEPDPYCSLFDLGGKVSGGSTSTATQGADVQFIPSATVDPGPPLVSTYPAGAGLLSLNRVLPSSAYFGPTGPLAASSSSSSPSLTMLLILGALIGGGAWLLLRKRR